MPPLEYVCIGKLRVCNALVPRADINVMTITRYTALWVLCGPTINVAALFSALWTIFFFYLLCRLHENYTLSRKIRGLNNLWGFGEHLGLRIIFI